MKQSVKTKKKELEIGKQKLHFFQKLSQCSKNILTSSKNFYIYSITPYKKVISQWGLSIAQEKWQNKKIIDILLKQRVDNL